jgi:hypothetical protein
LYAIYSHETSSCSFSSIGPEPIARMFLSPWRDLRARESHRFQLHQRRMEQK